MSVPLNELSPTRLWGSLDQETRAHAARCFYTRDWGKGSPKPEADFAIARTLRFRDAAVRRLPVEKRIEYLARAVRPDDSLISSLLLALHLEERKEMLTTFLDSLGFPHTDGLIDDSFDIKQPSAAVLASAVAAISAKHPAEQVEVYLMTLLALDPYTWTELKTILASDRS